MLVPLSTVNLEEASFFPNAMQSVLKPQEICSKESAADRVN
jgi:hypothetical protein